MKPGSTQGPDLLSTSGRVRDLLDAVLSMGGELDLSAILWKLIDASVELVDAEYGALGVVGDDRTLAQFLAVGIDEAGRERIGHLPRGRGILGLLVEVPEVLRLEDLTQHPSAYGFPPHHPMMRSFLGVPVRVRGEVFGIMYHTEKRGGRQFDADDEAVALAIASAAGVAIENSRLYDEARHREQWIAASSEVTTAVLSGDDAGDVLGLVAERARDLLGATDALVSLPDGTGALTIEVVVGEGRGDLRGVRLPAGKSLAAEVFESEATMNVADFSTHPRASHYWEGLSELPGPALLVPLVSSLGVRGVLTVTRVVGSQPFDPSAVAMLRGFADQAALVLEIAEHRKDAARSLVLQDRDRIARDLHDLVIQRLFATGMKLESVLPQTDRPDAVAAVVHDSIDELDATIREIRTTIYSLQESARRPAATRSRLFQVVEEAAQVLPFAPSVRIEGLLDTRVPAVTADHLVAVLREALSNVVRHAEATRVEITVDVRDDEVVLAVADDGVGIPVESTRRSGLANLDERAASLGGKCVVERLDAGGTRMVWSVPLPG